MDQRERRVRDAELRYRVAASDFRGAVALWGYAAHGVHVELERARMALREAVIFYECGGGG